MAKTPEKKKPTPEHDPWFNPYRYPASERSRIAMGELLYEFEQQENRKRARKKEDRQWLWDVGYPLLADLAYHYLNGSPGQGLIVLRAKDDLSAEESRYHPAIFTRSFPGLLDALRSFGCLAQRKGEYSGMPGRSKRTTIHAGPRLIELINKHQIGFEDLRVNAVEEVIILKRAKRGYWDQGEKISYTDTAVTKRLRAEVRELNSWLERADISFDANTYDQPVDVRARRLYRYFAADFKSGGRLFKGFWENLPKRARLLGLRIQGESVVELDYAQLNPMLAYAKVGCPPPSGDAYTLPGLEMSRDGVKRVFNALLFDKGPRRSFPKGEKVRFPAKTKIGDVVAAIRDKHPMLGSVLSTGAGFHLMYLESEIMMRVLEQLRYQAIVGLPIFDGVIVKSSKAEAAKAVMKEQFKMANGLEIEVRLEQASVPHVH